MPWQYPLVASGIPRSQLRLTQEGILDEPFPVAVTAASSPVVSQRVYGALVGLQSGDLVTGVMLRISTAAAGTSPTTARFGLADATGKMLALSGNLNAAASWPAGAAPFALAAPYQITSAGGYYICFVVNGTWGTTAPLLAAQTFGAAGAASGFGTAAPPFFTWDTQTDLPAVGASLTLTASAASRYMAVY